MLNGSYEVGDKVVLLNWDNNNRLLTIKKVYEHNDVDIFALVGIDKMTIGYLPSLLMLNLRSCKWRLIN